MKLLNAIIAGLSGSSALTLVHEIARRLFPRAPRADILGVRALEKGFFAVGEQPPAGDKIHRLALGTDIVVNTAYYALVATTGRSGAWANGLGLGLLGGMAAIILPGPLGLGQEPTERTRVTKAMTVAWYTLGGAVAALVYRLLTRLPMRQANQ
ncbi:MAG: hypothetical protein R6X18_15265 [Chloroflexota bacterium]|jgi:hypothetical protein